MTTKKILTLSLITSVCTFIPIFFFLVFILDISQKDNLDSKVLSSTSQEDYNDYLVSLESFKDFSHSRPEVQSLVSISCETDDSTIDGSGVITSKDDRNNLIITTHYLPLVNDKTTCQIFHPHSSRAYQVSVLNINNTSQQNKMLDFSLFTLNPSHILNDDDNNKTDDYNLLTSKKNYSNTCSSSYLSKDINLTIISYRLHNSKFNTTPTINDFTVSSARISHYSDNSPIFSAITNQPISDVNSFAFLKDHHCLVGISTDSVTTNNDKEINFVNLNFVKKTYINPYLQ